MTPPSPTTFDLHAGPSAVPWRVPRVTAVAAARPAAGIDAVSPATVEWLPRSAADRRL